MSDRFSLKLGRFYDGDKILQHEEVLELLNNFDELLEEVRHELVCITGLKAYDNNSNDSFELDYTKLIKRIDEHTN